MTVSTNRKQQITDELSRLGIDPTNEAIQAVIEILKSDSRKTPKSACKAYAQKLSGDTNNRQKTTTKPPDGEIKTGLGQLSQNLKNQLKQQVVSAAVAGLVRDLQMGDYGDLNDLASEELGQLIDAEFSVLEVSDLDPKYLPPSSSESKLLLNATPTES